MNKIIKLLFFINILSFFYITSANNSDIPLTQPVSYRDVLDKNYKDSELVNIRDYSKENNLGLQTDYNIFISKKVINDLSKLIKSCKISNRHISISSGYRSYDYQKEIFKSYGGWKAGVAKEGTSEHQTGLAVDINTLKNQQTIDCLHKNMYNYGFIISYPKGNNYLNGLEIYEPWHYRYIGKRGTLLIQFFNQENKPLEFLEKYDSFNKKYLKYEHPLSIKDCDTLDKNNFYYKSLEKIEKETGVSLVNTCLEDLSRQRLTVYKANKIVPLVTKNKKGHITKANFYKQLDNYYWTNKNKAYYKNQSLVSLIDFINFYSAKNNYEKERLVKIEKIKRKISNFISNLSDNNKDKLRERLKKIKQKKLSTKAKIIIELIENELLFSEKRLF